MDTAGRYRRFAEVEANRISPLYAELAAAIATDREMCARLDALPAAKRQPNLLFAATCFVGGKYADSQAFTCILTERWAEVEAVMRRRRTQTNEVGRCAVLLPALAALPQPLALLEVGASAGLCLYPDRYRYAYLPDSAGPPMLGDGPGPVLRCQTRGPVPVPTRRPEVVWRRGIDLDPVDLTDPEARRWLECLIWPGPTYDERVYRLRGAIAVARAEPVQIVTGDLMDRVADVAATAPGGATLVIFHSAVLVYLPPDQRRDFAAAVADLDATWLANEAPGVVIGPFEMPETAAAAPGTTLVLTAGGTVPLAVSDGHGAWLEWL